MKTILITDDDIHIGNMLEEIREIPTIILSAKAEVNGKVDLLLGGAVDYVTKPFHTKELLARIQVALRNPSPAPRWDSLSFRNITLDADSRTVSTGDGSIHLTRTECAILNILMSSPSRVIAKSVLLDRISRDTPDCVESSLKVHISNLRKKLREITGENYIETVWGIGFKMRES